jgi:hypothetical protein
VSFGAAQVRADQELPFDMPAAIATAETGRGGPMSIQMDAEFSLVPPLVFHSKYAFAREDLPAPYNLTASASAQAIAASNGYTVMAHASNGMIGAGEAYLRLLVHDPENRPTIKLVFRYKASASTGGKSPTGGWTSGRAEWDFSVGFSGRAPSVVLGPDGTIKSIASPRVGWPPLLETTGVYEIADWAPSGAGAIIVYRDGQVAERNAGYGSATEKRSIDLTIRPDTEYLVALTATALNRGQYNNSLAAIDPEILPHPDNPDVVIKLETGLDPTPRSPLDGLTMEQLAAEGLAVDALQQIGLFEAPAPTDTTPPSTVATPAPGPNSSGWNNTPVTVTFAATDNSGGSGIKEIYLSFSGAATGSQVVPGNSASATIIAEGITTVTYFAVDHAGNQEAAKTLTLRIDEAPPTLLGLPSTGCTLWPPDRRMVQVATVTASDALSGLASGSLAISATSNEPVSGSDPDIVVTNGIVQVRAERMGSGKGRIYTISASAMDQAGNTQSATGTCTVPHDQGSPMQP